MPFIFRPGGTNRPLLKQIPYYTAFNPRSIGTCALWLDGNDPAGTGARPSNGTTLTTWVDKSGSGYSTTSGNGVFYSQYQNGNGVVYISAATSMGLPNITTVPMTIFLVGKLVTNAANSFLLALGFNNGSATYLRANYPNSFYGVDSGYQSVGATVSGGRFNIATTNQDSNYHIWSYTQTTNSFFYFDGTEIGSVTTPANSTTTTFTNNTLGGWNNSPNSVASVICEVIFYNSILSTPDRQQIESYLAQKWGLTTTLPSTHLNATRPAGIPAVSFLHTNGFNLIAALLSGFMSTVYNLSTYSLAAIAATVTAGNSSNAYIWTVAVPTGAKGKNAILMLFFNLYSLTQFQANQYFDYGIYVDGVAQGFGDTGTARYIQTALGNYALNNGGITYGTNSMTPYQPLIIPLVLAAGATTIQLGIKNSQSTFTPIASTQIGYLSNNLTTTIGSGSNTSSFVPQTVFTTAGSNNYTVPTLCSAGSVTGVYIFCWGSGGYCQAGAAAGGSGAGGFASGYYACAGGTVLRYVIGLSDSLRSVNTGGSGPGYGTGGGGFTGVFLSNASGLVQSNALVIAGGGGGAATQLASSGHGGGGSYLTNASGVGYAGGNSYVYGTGVSSTVTGGTLSAGGLGSGAAADALLGGGTVNSTQAGGGGGYYGGGAGNTGGTTDSGGGSSFAATAVVGPAFGSAAQTTSLAQGQTQIPPGSNTSTYYYKGPTGSFYGYGGWIAYNPATLFQGVIAIVPAIGANPVNVGVSAQLYSA